MSTLNWGNKRLVSCFESIRLVLRNPAFSEGMALYNTIHAPIVSGCEHTTAFLVPVQTCTPGCRKSLCHRASSIYILLVSRIMLLIVVFVLPPPLTVTVGALPTIHYTTLHYTTTTTMYVLRISSVGLDAPGLISSHPTRRRRYIIVLIVRVDNQSECYPPLTRSPQTARFQQLHH